MALNPIAINEYIQVRFYCQDDEQGSVNTFMLQCVARTALGITDKELADRLDITVGVLFPAILNNNASYRGVGVKSMNIGPGRAEVFSKVSAGVGTAGAEALPRQTAGLVSFYTGYPGRRGRGRMYMPFPAQDDNQATGHPVAGYVTAVESLVDALLGLGLVIGAAGDCTFIPVLYHREAASGDKIETRIVRAVWATQRRRGAEGSANVSPI